MSLRDIAEKLFKEAEAVVIPTHAPASTDGTTPAPAPTPAPPAVASQFKYLSAVKIGFFLLTLAGWGFGAWQSFKAGAPIAPIPTPPVIQNVQEPIPPQLALSAGWVNDPEEVSRIVAVNKIPAFAATPAGRAVMASDDDVYLWDAAKVATGAVLPDRNQGQVGSCVSFGTACAIEHLICVQIVQAKHAGQPPPEFKALCQEVIYGGSRVEVGKGKISGDGSVGAWAAQFVQQWGVVPRGQVGSYDLAAYSETRCRQFGKSGVPAELETVAKQSPVKGVSQVNTAAEGEKAIRQGYPIAVCSGLGFASTRDRDGFARQQGSWGHCQAVIGVRKGSRPGFFIENSWGSDWISGPRYPADAPTGGYWVEWSVFDRMCKEGDTWAFSDAVGFPSRELEWIVRDDARNKSGLLASRPGSSLLVKPGTVFVGDTLYVPANAQAGKLRNGFDRLTGGANLMNQNAPTVPEIPTSNAVVRENRSRYLLNQRR